MNPFQREVYDKYISFIELAMQYFPNHMSFKLAKEKEPDFKLLLSLIFDARNKYPGYKEESMKLCEDIAHFSERNTDKSERVMFEYMLIRECEAGFSDIIAHFMNPILDTESIAIQTKEIAEHFLIEEVKKEFRTEDWAAQLIDVDIDIDVLMALIMNTDRYVQKDEKVLAIVQQLAEYANKNIMKSDRPMFVEMHIMDVALAKSDIIQKFALKCKEKFPEFDYILPKMFEKNPPTKQTIIVETSQKPPKEKRRISENNKLLELLKKQQTFSISSSRVNTETGIKRVVIKNCFEDVVSFLEKNLPEKATLKMDQGSAKVVFANNIEHKKKPRYQRVSR